MIERLALLVQEQILLPVHTYEKDSLARIYSQAAEAASSGLQHHGVV